jgi:AraC family transcriptional regulator
MTPVVHGPQLDQLFRANVLLSARARAHTVKSFPGPLSVKSVVSGEAVWRVGGQNYPVDRTSCLIVAHGEPYDMTIRSDVPVETFVVFFADAMATDVTTVRMRPLARLLDDPAARASDEFPITRRLWNEESSLPQALHRLRTGEAADVASADAGLRDILDAFADLAATVRNERDRIQAASATTRAELHHRVLKGRAVLDDTVADAFDLDAIAAEACLSPHHFHRTFSAALGEAPYAYVARRRIERARRLLEESDMPVAEVCVAVGYESVASFTTRFRKLVGQPPAAYRAQFRKDG